MILIRNKMEIDFSQFRGGGGWGAWNKQAPRKGSLGFDVHN